MLKKLLKNKAVKGVIIAVLCACLLGGVAVVGINAYVFSYVSDYILTEEDLESENFDCIMVLGAGLWDGEPSPMLQERLDFGLKAYETGCSEKLALEESTEYVIKKMENVYGEDKDKHLDYKIVNSISPNNFVITLLFAKTEISIFLSFSLFNCFKNSSSDTSGTSAG